MGLALLALALAAGAKADPTPPPAYRIIDLGKLGFVTGINNLGQVAGSLTNSAGYYDAAVYDTAGIHDLGTLGGTGLFSQATAINNRGQIVGVGATPPITNGLYQNSWTSHAVLFDATGVHDLGTLGGDQSNALGINDAGQIFGESEIEPGGAHPFFYSNGVMRDLGSPPGFVADQNTFLVAKAINGSGQVLVATLREVTTDDGTAPHAGGVYLWQNGVWQPVRALDGMGANGLNDAGQIVGSTSLLSSLTPAGHAFLYDGAGLRDLGTLGGSQSVATALNNEGEVVGTSQVVAPPSAHPWLYEYADRVPDHPFLYSMGGMYDLTSLLLTSAPWERFMPIAINDRGEIVGQAIWGVGTASTQGSRSEYYLLEPDPTAQVTVPAAPTNATLKLVSVDELDLTWTDTSNNEQSFEIQRRQSWNDWVTIGSVPPNTTTYADTSVAPYTHYLYRVRAVDGAGASDWSGEAAGDSGSGAVVQLGWTAQDFGSVALGTTSSLQSLTITNRGTAPLQLQPATLAGSNPGDFTVVDSPTTLAPGDTGALHLRFTPTALGSRSAQLILPSNAVQPVGPIGLTGTGAPPSGPPLTVTPTTLDFGQQPVGLNGSLAVALQNTSAVPLPIGTLAFQGANPGDFSLATDGVSGRSLAPGAIALLNIHFLPTATGSRTATIVIPTAAGGSSQSITLTGTGTAPLLRASADSLIFALQAPGATQTVSFTNHGDAPLAIQSIALGGPDAGSFKIVSDTGEATLAPGASRTLTVRFNPASVTAAHRAHTAAARIAAVGYSAALEIQDNDPHPTSPHQIALVALAPPAAPGNLTATVTAGLQIQLTWSNPAPDPHAYVTVWRQEGTGAWTRVALLPGDASRFTDTSVSGNASYTYQAHWVNGPVVSPWSNLAHASTAGAVLAPPGGLTATVGSGPQVRLSWSLPAPNPYAYLTVWRQAAGGEWTRVALLRGDVTRFTDTTVQPGTSYRYHAHLVTDPAVSAWSNTATASTPTAGPAQLTAVAGPGAQVVLTWTNAHPDAGAWVTVWRQSGSGAWTRVALLHGDVASFTDTQVSAGGSYRYRAHRVDGADVSDWSNEAVVVLP